MRKHALVWIGALILALSVAAPARAITYEDSFEECNYPKTFDLMIMRPLSLMTMVAGTVLFVPMAPLAILTVGREVGTIYDNLVASPARFTFSRNLGECTSIDLNY